MISFILWSNLLVTLALAGLKIWAIATPNPYTSHALSSIAGYGAMAWLFINGALTWAVAIGTIIIGALL